MKSKLGCGKDILVVMVWPELALDPRLDGMTPRSAPKGSRALAAEQATCRDGDSQNLNLVVKSGESAASLKFIPIFAINELSLQPAAALCCFPRELALRILLTTSWTAKAILSQLLSTSRQGQRSSISKHLRPRQSHKVGENGAVLSRTGV